MGTDGNLVPKEADAHEVRGQDASRWSLSGAGGTERAM
jgi:hypothetical protein